MRGLDPFQVVRLGLAAVDDVRRRVQHDTTGHRGLSRDPLYGIRRVLRRHRTRLSTKARGRLQAGLIAGDPDGEAALAPPRRIERAHREPQPEDQEHEADRPRLPQLRPLPAATVAEPRTHPRRSLTDANQNPRSQVRCVEPLYGVILGI